MALSAIDRLRLGKELRAARADLAQAATSIARLKVVKVIREIRQKLGIGTASAPAQDLNGVPTTTPMVFYRSVSPEEWEHIQKTGAITGGQNTFNGFDKRRLVFFGAAKTAKLIWQGEDKTRRGEYAVQQTDLNARYNDTQSKYNELQSKMDGMLANGGNKWLPEYKEAQKEASALGRMLSDLEAQGRGKIAEAREAITQADAARGYTSVVLTTKPLVGLLEFSGKHSGMGDENEYGAQPGQVKLSDIASYTLVQDGKELGEQVPPQSAATTTEGVTPPADTTANPHIVALRAVTSGGMDAQGLNALYGTIQEAVNGLNDAGDLVGDAVDAANDAITHWADLEIKTYG